MIDQTISTPVHPSRTRLPLQSAPIDRSSAPAAAVPGGAGVEADGWWDDIVGGAKDVIGLASTAAPLLGMLSDRRIKRDLRPVRWTR